MNASTDHPAALPIEQLLKQCDVTRTRRGGPGGQHCNKVETAVVLRHEPSGVTGEASERRSQEENHQAAIFRLRVNLALKVRHTRPVDQEPSPLWRSRCRNRKVVVNAGHEDFPALLAEALDTLDAHNGNAQSAASALGCSTSQLAKLFRAEPKAQTQVNEERKRRGLRPLK